MFTIRLTRCLVLALILTFAIDSYAQKMAPEEIIAKHLDSMGTKEKRAEIKNQLILGDVRYNLKGSTAVLNGKGIILSSGEKNL